MKNKFHIVFFTCMPTIKTKLTVYALPICICKTVNNNDLIFRSIRTFEKRHDCVRADVARPARHEDR